MNDLLQKHGCFNVFTVPEGLKELMADISREVLRDQPIDTLDYIANYLSVLLVTREHGVLAVKILDDLCDCKPSVNDHLVQIGFEKSQADVIADIIKLEVEATEPRIGKEKVKETEILKKILNRFELDEEMSAKVCQIARNAYRDYWYRRKVFKKHMKVERNEPWQIAAQRTLELYKKTRPSFSELTRATQKIQAAYRGYYVRRKMLKHLLPKEPPKKPSTLKRKDRPRVGLAGPPLDIAMEREIDLGPVIDIQVKDDNVTDMFDEHVGETLGLKYDPMKTITHVEEEFLKAKEKTSKAERRTVTVESMYETLTSRELGSKSESKTRSSMFEQTKRKTETLQLKKTKGQRKCIIDSNKQRTAAHFFHRISFAQYPAEIINFDNFDDDDDDVPEDKTHFGKCKTVRIQNVQVPQFRVQEAKTPVQEKVEIQGSKAVEEIMGDDFVEDVSENIQGDLSDGDYSVESGLTATATLDSDHGSDPRDDSGDELPDEQE